MTEQIDLARQAGASNTTTWSGAAADVRTPPFLAHPKDVLDDAAHSVEQKRLILASWLSDEHAVPDAPRWRELENGAFVDVHEIEEALRVLDDMEATGRSGDGRGSSSSFDRQKSWKERFGGIIRRSKNDDDDNPPPSPVTVCGPVPPRNWDMGATAELSFAD
jgi:hypothetical protein